MGHETVHSRQEDRHPVDLHEAAGGPGLFADDISLLSHRQQGAQEKLCCVAAEAKKTGLQNNMGRQRS